MAELADARHSKFWDGQDVLGPWTRRPDARRRLIARAGAPAAVHDPRFAAFWARLKVVPPPGM